jgi:hypothetical protein
MTKTQIRDSITKIHFYLLGFSILNFTLKNTIEISLNYELAYFITLLVYASAIILFFWNFKPFKKIGIYFSLYFVTPILALLFWLFGGIFLAISASIVLIPIYSNEIKAENDKIVIYEPYQGFLSQCCIYQVNEKKFYLLEKKVKEINVFELVDFKNIAFEPKKKKLELTIKHKTYDYKTKKTIETDTIITIKME